MVSEIQDHALFHISAITYAQDNYQSGLKNKKKLTVAVTSWCETWLIMPVNKHRLVPLPRPLRVTFLNLVRILKYQLNVSLELVFPFLSFFLAKWFNKSNIVYIAWTPQFFLFQFGYQGCPWTILFLLLSLWPLIALFLQYVTVLYGS